MSHYFSVKQGKFQGKPFNFSFMDKNYLWQGAKGVFSGSALDDGATALLSVVIKDSREDSEQGLSQQEFELLDLGCGTGIVGLVYAMEFPDSKVVLSDINAWAVQCSAANGKKNKIANATYLIEDQLNALSDRSFDIIAFNPPIRAGNELILSMFEDSARVLKKDGSLYIVVRAKQGAKRMAELASKWYDHCEFKIRKKGYLVFRLSVPKPGARLLG